MSADRRPDLAQMHCVPAHGVAMAGTELAGQLARASGWALAGARIEKTFSFRHYQDTMAFVNAVAAIAQAEDHHPELVVTFSRCVVRFDTHSVGGLSINDFICAAKVDVLIAQQA